MRIIGGALKSRKIQFPKNRLTRPMTDRSKETIFNVLGEFVEGKRVLDLYAGSGSLGLESLSRGAEEVHFVDRADWAISVIKKNLELLDLNARSKVIQIDVLRTLEKFKKMGVFFDLIFVDPPFQQGLVKKTLIKLDQSGIVSPFGQVVVGHIRQEELPETLENIRVMKTKIVGQACLSFLINPARI